MDGVFAFISCYVWVARRDEEIAAELRERALTHGGVHPLQWDEGCNYLAVYAVLQGLREEAEQFRAARVVVESSATEVPE